MNPGAQLQYELTCALATLRRRRASSGEIQEQKVLTRTIARLNKDIAALENAAPLATAEVLSDAIDRLEAAVGAARHGPFDGYLGAIEGHLASLSAFSETLHRVDALPASLDEGDDEGVNDRAVADTEAAVARGAALARAGLAAPARATDFATLRDEYAAWYAMCSERPERHGEVAYYVKRLRQGQSIYQQLGDELGIPWPFIGVIHGMECGFNFTTHLHNGDPLAARTTHVPAGRPAAGSPPFTWRESARDALIFKGYHQIDEWSVARQLYLLERYNGMGYRRRGVPTPYLWSFSTLYDKGKFVADGRFDPQAVSRQCGAALMLKAMLP